MSPSRKFLNGDLVSIATFWMMETRTLSPSTLFEWWRQVNFNKSLYRDLVSLKKIILWGHCLNHHFWKCLNNHFQKWKTRKYNQLLSLTDHSPFYQSKFRSWLLFLTLPLILFLMFLYYWNTLFRTANLLSQIIDKF